MVSEGPAANRITVNAAEQDDHIESVTVFQSDRAEVKRRVSLELKKGQNHVHIERLPSCVNEDSIRVDGTGSAVIFDVVYHAPAPCSITSTNEEIATAQRSLDLLQKQREIAKEQYKFLASYGQTLDTKSINFEDVQRFLDMFGPRQIAVSERIAELDVEVEKAESELNKARSKSYEDAAGEKRGTRITVTVLAETDGDAELILTYVVTNASWTPLYDVRASIPKSPEASSTVTLHYRASITQTTGENWPDVALTLSTASPQLGSSVPTLTPWRVGFPAPPSPMVMKRAGGGPTLSFGAQARRKSIKSTAAREVLAEDDDDNGPTAEYYRLAAPMMRRLARVATAGILSAAFGIPGRSDIPSDEGSHKVVIAVLDLQADLEWICVPREKESVFLTCKVVNASDFTLLPGEASVFMDDNFVSKSRIEHVAPNDSFKTSLGVDSALRVTYPAAKTLNRAATHSNFAFLAKERQTVSAQSQRITVRNSRPASVSSLRVLDHVPVSTDTQIKVNVITPNGLDAPMSPNEGSSEDKKKEHPWFDVQKGVKARWASLDVGGEGTVEWNCEVAPTEEIELELAWEVSAPAGSSSRIHKRSADNKNVPDPSQSENIPAQPATEAIPEYSHRLTSDLMGNIITLYLVSLLSNSSETIRAYRLQGKKKLPQAVVPLVLSAKSIRDLTTERWRTIWATCGHESCPLHAEASEDMGLAPDNRIITTNEGCLEPDADLSPYFQLLYASINYHGDWKWDTQRQSFCRWQNIVAFPASLTRLEMLHIHGGEEEIIATVSRCCPNLVELRLVRCTMFNHPDCLWWRQHSHDYFQDPAEDHITSYADNMVGNLLHLSNLQVLHLGHYLMNKLAVDIHRTQHVEYHPFHDESNPFAGMGVSSRLEAIARQNADGGPPVNMQVPPLARREFWETPCPRCRDQLSASIEGTEHLTTSILARLGSLRMVSFPNFLSEKGIRPCNWHIKREINPSIQDTGNQWEEVDAVQRLYEDGTRMRVTVTGERSNRQLPPFTFTMRTGAWEL